MSELWLIAHKVRGEVALDVAERMDCPKCNGCGFIFTDWGKPDCAECNGLGYWWIIPTSGHRAYPWWSGRMQIGDYVSVETEFVGEMPKNLPDHYAHREAPSQLESLLALIPTKPAPQMKRRL